MHFRAARNMSEYNRPEQLTRRIAKLPQQAVEDTKRVIQTAVTVRTCDDQ